VLLHPLAARVPRKFTQNLGRGVLGTFATVFCEKMGPFYLGGMPPVVALEGGLVFWGKPSRPLTLFILVKVYIRTTNWGVGCVNNEKNLKILPKGRSDVAVGCSKRW
jgi:hypothetical protein